MGLLIPPLKLNPDDQIRAAIVASTTTSFALEAVWARKLNEAPEIVRLGGPGHSSGDRTLETTAFDIAGGYLYGLHTGAAIGIKRGQLYAQLQVGRRGRFFTLSRGYVTQITGLQMGDLVESGPGGGEGFIRSIDLGDPADGADYTDQTVPTNSVWKLRGFAGTLTTNASAATRFPHIHATDGTVRAGGLGHSTGLNHTASLIINYSGGNGLNLRRQNALTNGFVQFALSDMSLPEGYEITFETEALAAGDGWGSGQILVEEWIVI